MIRGLEHLFYGVGVIQPGEDKAPGRPCSSLPVTEGGLQESCRRSFYKSMYR